MAAINPPTSIDTLRLALIPGQETVFLQACEVRLAEIGLAIQNLPVLLDEDQQPLFEQLDQERLTWTVLSQASGHLRGFRAQFFNTTAVTTTAATLLYYGKIKLLSAPVAIVGSHGTYVSGSRLIQAAHRFLDRAHRLTIHPENAQAIRNEFTHILDMEDGNQHTIIDVDNL